MSEIRNRLKELNPDLFGMRQPSIKHEVVIVGRRDRDTKEVTYLLRSKPSKGAIAANFKAVNFLHAAFKPIGSIITDANGTRSFSGPKKARVGNIFQPTQPDLYQYVKESLYEMKEDGEGKIKPILLDEKEGTYKKAGFDAEGRPQVRLRDTVFGARIVMNTDLYVPHNTDPESGLSVPLTANTRNPKTGKYEPQEVVRGIFEFFADDDDLDKLLETCAKHWTKNVEPWVTAKIETKTIQGNKVITEVKEAAMTGEEDFIIDEYGNGVDNTGDIIFSPKELAALGVTAAEGETIKLKRTA